MFDNHPLDFDRANQPNKGLRGCRASGSRPRPVRQSPLERPGASPRSLSVWLLFATDEDRLKGQLPLRRLTRKLGVVWTLRVD